MSKPVLFLLAGLLLAASASSGPAMSYDHPDTAFASNVAIDIIRHANGIWLATSNGLNYSLDSGRTWLLYNTENGLVSNDVSAMCSSGGRLWVATNHTQEVQGSSVSYSDGVSYSDDVGQSWTRVRFDTLTPPIDYVFGAFRTIYDITAAGDRVFFSAFAGGFISSADTGKTWRRLFASKTDSINFSDFYGGLVGSLNLRNEYFSCVADTSHGDSFFVWAGTAGGILQYIFLEPKDKFYAGQVQALAFSPDSNLLFAGGSGCVSRGTRLGRQFVSRFGIGGDAVTAMTTVGSRLLMGVNTKNPIDPSPPSLQLSDDNGEFFSDVPLTPGSGVIHEFAAVRSRIYLGADSGLFVSSDSGSTWSHLWADSSNVTPANRRNVVNGLSSLGDTLWLGTDSGLVILHLDSTGMIDSSAYHVFAETDSSGSRVIRVRVQSFGSDSIAVWTVNRAALPSGVPMVSRWSSQYPAEWVPKQVNEITNDIGFVGDSVLFLQKFGVRLTRDIVDPTVYMVIRDSTDNTIVVSDNSVTSLRDSVFCMRLLGDTLIFGTGRGIAVSVNRGRSFKVIRAQLDRAVPDVVVNYTYLNTLNTVPGEGSKAGMTGDFVPALGIQYVPDSTARIYASCRRVEYGADGVSWGRVVLDTVNDVVIHRYRWDPIYTEGFAWNFESLGRDTVLLATEYSLLVIAHPGDQTQTTDSLVFKSKTGRDLLFKGTPVYSVRADDTLIWVGTDDGTIRINRGSLSAARLYIVTDPVDEIYAFPTPFSPNRDQRVRFHFKLDAAAYVTLEVYDFAMNLVSRPLDNVHFAAGVYPPGDPEDSERPFWDGRNGRGDLVAVGVYYFKITYSTGEAKWGKLAVMP